MSKNRNGEPYVSKADRLIEEAVRAVEEQERRLNVDPVEVEKNQDEEAPPVVAAKKKDREEKDRTTGSIAKIDLQQYVEKEAYLRLAADFENFRKRSHKERSEAERGGKEKTLRAFLEIFDNLERGISQSKDQDSALASGIKMIISQAEIWLKSEGLERISTQGQLFDPAIHEAISQIETSEKIPGTVLEEVKRGYRWPDRLLRPASVVVCRAPSVSENNSNSDLDSGAAPTTLEDESDNESAEDILGQEEENHKKGEA